MKTITEIIEIMGGWDHLRSNPIKVENEGWERDTAVKEPQEPNFEVPT